MVFQVDSNIVIEARKELANYSIEYDDNSPNKDLCVIWFSSNAIYFPNNEVSFKSSILDKDYYEWRTETPLSARKNIFLRDIYKQWYLLGINDFISTPPQLLKFLKEQTRGYRVITVGSSAGGYAACLYGNWLGAERIYAFNAQFELNSLLKTSTADINPLLFSCKDDTNLRPLYDIEPLINATPIIYFVSEQSDWDASQMKHIGNKQNLTTVIVKSSHHGVPFPRVALGPVLSHQPSKLQQLDGNRFTPWQLSIHFVGVYKTLIGSINQGVKLIKKKMHHA